MDQADADGFSPEARMIWPAVGDLMACLFGLFVLFFVWLVTAQYALTEDLRAAEAAHEATAARLETIERALAGPLSRGLVTVVNGRIGIRGSVLFPSNSADLSPEGLALLQELAPPLHTYLETHTLSVMVAGFTDDLPLHGGGFRDNWELSSARALAVTRTLVEAGIPAEWLFAAGFGSNHPVAANASEEGRAQNRRVEISPVPRPAAIDLTRPTP
jgi:flagellar motor protein MotB